MSWDKLAKSQEEADKRMVGARLGCRKHKQLQPGECLTCAIVEAENKKGRQKMKYAKSDLVEVYEAAKGVLALDEIVKCPNGRWSTADNINYRAAERLRRAIAKAEGGK